MVNNNYQHEDLVSNILECANKVYAQLGQGYPENIYQRALAIELERLDISFIREQEWPVFYDKELLIGKRSVDFVIENSIMLDIKSNTDIISADYKQFINNIEAFHFDLGLLINFGRTSLEFKRFTNNNINSDKNELVMH